MTPEARRYATRFAALGHEVRLEIVRRLIEAHPHGMVAGEIQDALNIPSSTLSHHLDALLHAKLVEQRREGRFLRYLAHTESLREILEFLYAECCTRNEELRILVPGPKITS
jgi:ArsR family transcriptional regulator, arsenate/arsenite/antimonite-responsive transcriptional repressor